MVLAVISPYSLPMISEMTPVARVGCRDVKSVFFSCNWTTFKLLPWVYFPLWVKSLKYCRKLHLTEMLVLLVTF